MINHNSFTKYCLYNYSLVYNIMTSSNKNYYLEKRCGNKRVRLTRGLIAAIELSRRGGSKDSHRGMVGD